MNINTDKFFESRHFRAILIGIGVFIMVLVIFSLGMFVGYRKATFSYQWGENYHRNFGGPSAGFLSDFNGRGFIGSHGTFGEIIKIDAQAVTIKGESDVEKIVLVDDKSTVIEKMMGNIKLGDLKVGDTIVVIGEPNNVGQIEAKLIRVMPGQPNDPAGFFWPRPIRSI